MARITAIKDRIRQMNQASFQNMCDAYLRKKGYSSLVELGSMAGAEKTTPGTPDTYVSLADGRYTFVEYTTQQESLPRKIKDDIDKCLDESKTHVSCDLIEKIIYIHNSSNIQAKDDHELKEYCNSHGIPLVIIGIDNLAYDLMQHYPSIVYDYLRIPLSTNQVQDIDDFIEQYDRNKTAAPLDTSFLFREKEMEQVDEKLKITDMIVITGPAGTGKTRFALEFARKHAHEHSEEIVCIHNLSLRIYEDLHMALEDPGNYFLIIDDANQISNFAMIVDLLNALPDDHSYKVLITVRDYAKSQVMETLANKAHYDSIELHTLTDNEISELVKQHFGILNQKYLDRIAEISDGNPRIAMLAGKIASDTNQLDSIRDVSGLYDAYYGAALRESSIPEDSVRLICAGIVAFLGVIHLDHIDPIYTMLDAKGITKEQFKSAMHKLHSAELVDIYYDTAVRISDQCFADYILKYVYYDKKLIPLGEMILICLKPYHGHTMRAISTLYGKYQNDEMRAFLDEEIKKVWHQLKDEKSDKFWDFLMTFFPINPVDTLLILKERIDNVECVPIPVSQIDTEKGKNNVSITDDYITVLGRFSGTTNLEAALDLFFAYYLKRPDLYIQFYHASCNSFGIKKDSHEIGYYTQLHYVQKVIQHSDNWRNGYITILFLEVMQEYLKLHFEPAETNRNDHLVIYQIPLYPSEAATNYRKLIWSQLIAIANMGMYTDKLKELLENYGQYTEECSLEVVKSDAPHIIQIIKLILSTDSLPDCLLVKELSEKLTRAEVDTSSLDAFLSCDKMDKYRILVGPDRRKGISSAEIQQLHRDSIVAYFAGSNNKTETFNGLYEIYCELKTYDYRAVSGINYAMKVISADTKGFISVAKIIMSRTENSGIDLPYIVYTLFQSMNPAEVKQIIKNNARSQEENWMYLYFLEMPAERIDDEIVQELYAFLQEEQMDASNGFPLRDCSFLGKYAIVDSRVYVKATEIVFGKRILQPHLVISYFGGLFRDEKKVSSILDAYACNTHLLCELYVFLYLSNWNLDHDGAYLCKLLEIDPRMKEMTADAIVKFREGKLNNDTDSRFCALYYTEQYIETVSGIVDRIIDQIECSDIYVPDALSAFLLVPQKKPDIITLQKEWVTCYIKHNAMSISKMSHVFRNVANHRFDLMRDCVAAFIECNKDFEAFKDLTITPTTYVGWGSFVPHYAKCIAVLESLLPLFTGIETIQHKNAVEQDIERYRRMIREEEISNIITG